MNKALVILLMSFVLIAGSVLASQVTNIEVFYRDGLTLARIDVDGTVRFSHQTEVAKDGKPFRVIVDVLSATHHLGARNFWALPKCSIERLRTSQYSVKPENVVRLVFDMKKETVYQVTSDDKSIVVSFPYPNGNQFSNWTTKEVVAKLVASHQEKKKAVASTSETQQTSGKKSAAEMNTAIENDRLASLQSTENNVKTTAPQSPKKEKQPQVVASTPKMINPDVDANVNMPQQPKVDNKKLHPEVSQPLTSKAETSESTSKQVPKKKVTSQKSSEVKTYTGFIGPVMPKVVLTEKPDTKESVKPKTTVLNQSESKQEFAAKSSQVKTTKSNQTQPSVSKKSSTSSVDKKTSKTQSKVEKSVDIKLAKADTHDKSSSKKTSKTAVVKTERDETTSTIAIKPSKATDKPDVDRVKTKDSQKPTSRFRRSPTRPTKTKGTLVAEFPNRLVIKYKTSGRDPFETLINKDKIYNSPVEQRVPNVDGLQLVGVIESGGKSNTALFEDKDGYGYILKKGDKVRNGYVLGVEKDCVYFQIFEYGWSRTLSLNLEE